MSKTDCILVSFDDTNGKDETVLIVGRKTDGEVAEIINAFQGDEARALYRKLTEKREGSE